MQYQCEPGASHVAALERCNVIGSTPKTKTKTKQELPLFGNVAAFIAFNSKPKCLMFSLLF